MTTDKIAYSFVASLSLLPSDEGGRKRPVFSHYRPVFSFNTKQYFSGEIELINKDELFPGETSPINVRLLPSKHIRHNLSPGDAFAIHEGERIVGLGFIKTVTERELI